MYLTIKLCTHLFEIELIICIKMDLALNNLQRFICHNTQTAQPIRNNIFMVYPCYYKVLDGREDILVEFPFFKDQYQHYYSNDIVTLSKERLDKLITTYQEHLICTIDIPMVLKETLYWVCWW